MSTLLSAFGEDYPNLTITFLHKGEKKYGTLLKKNKTISGQFLIRTDDNVKGWEIKDGDLGMFDPPLDKSYIGTRGCLLIDASEKA